MKSFLRLSLILVVCTCTFRGRSASDGYIAAVLRSACTSAPKPPPVGQTVVGPDYVITTVANGDPLDAESARQIVTDAIFESLMPLYCGLPDRGCITNRVQWGILTYDAAGSPKMSMCAASGCGPRYCSVTNGYMAAVISGELASLPRPSAVGQIAVGADAVVMTIADADPMDFDAAQQLATDAVFESLMRHYCALPRGTGNGYVSGRARWSVATFDTEGNLNLSGCAASGCDFHECMVSRGYVTATLRSACTSAPPPPPVGAISVGPDYVIMTVADGDPFDFLTAQQFATVAVFQSLMPLYCGLPGPCVSDRVQWNLLTYDAGGFPKQSGSPASGSALHDVGPCSLTPQQAIQNLIVWVNVDISAGILDRRQGNRLTNELSAALRQVVHGHKRQALQKLKGFIRDVNGLMQTQQLPAPAGQTLIDAASAIAGGLQE